MGGVDGNVPAICWLARCLFATLLRWYVCSEVFGDLLTVYLCVVDSVVVAPEMDSHDLVLCYPWPTSDLITSVRRHARYFVKMSETLQGLWI